MAKTRACRCGCGVTFVPERKDHIYATDACKKRASRAGKATRRRQFGKDLAGAEIRRLWGDAPVIDAKTELRVMMLPQDLRGAERKNPAACAFARACRRQFESGKVLFFRNVAYVELPDEKGAVRVERFLLSSPMRALVESFDRGEGVIPKGGFKLRPPAPSETLEGRRRKEKAARQRPRLDGEAVAPRPARKRRGRQNGAAPLAIDLAVRSGSGAVHFTRRTKAD